MFVSAYIMITSTGSTLILAYLNEKNRPYSAQDVFCNLQKQHGFGKTVRLILTYKMIVLCVSVAYN